VVVPDDQLALAIGKEGMNARLAHRLTGWKIDIVSDTEFAQQEATAAFGGDGDEENDFSGRCSATLGNGKRCPNAALPLSKYCGVPAHQALALLAPDDEVNPIVQEDEPELEALADVTEPDSVTADAAEFGNPEPEMFAAGPGDAPVAGFDQTPDSGGPVPVHVVDDPDEGIPIVHVEAHEDGDAGSE
jgi:N utilization substance protein A